MKLYEVTNGSVGNGAVHCLVIAPNIATAIGLAVTAFQLEAARQAYDASYWQPQGLTARVIFDTLDHPAASAPRDAHGRREALPK